MLAPRPRWPAPITRGFSVSVFQCFSVSVPAPRTRWLNDKYHSPRIYSWVEFGSRDTPNLIPRTSNLILFAISIRFVIITVSATVQISNFKFQISDFRSVSACPETSTKRLNESTEIHDFILPGGMRMHPVRPNQRCLLRAMTSYTALRRKAGTIMNTYKSFHQPPRRLNIFRMAVERR